MIALLVLALAAPSAHAQDWSMWGRTPSRNMTAKDKKVPLDFDPGTFVRGSEEVDMATTRGIKWVAKLGSQSYGNPAVVDGRVYVGTNNALARRPDFSGDYSLLIAFEEDDGGFLWQLTVPKLGSGKVNDWDWLGLCSSPTVFDGLLYVVSTRGDIMALDVDGLRDGNDGFADEAGYMARGGAPAPSLIADIDADIVWTYDVPDELGVFPHNTSSNAPLVIGDRVYVATSNGVDWSHIDIPSPFAPAFIALDRHTGALLGEEAAGISERLLHANWASPTWVPKKGKKPATVVFAGGDGFMYGFGPDPVDQGGLKVLPELWRVDGNPPGYRTDDAGNPRKYATPDGPSEFIGTPVLVDGVLYTAIGQDPEHGPGRGALLAVPAWSSGAENKPLWTYTGIGRSISTVAVADGLVYAADYEGRLHCVDAATGAVQWVYDTKAHIWGSPLVVAGHVFLGDEDGVLHVLPTGRALGEAQKHAFPAPIYSSPILANKVLYVATQTHLYAIDGL